MGQDEGGLCQLTQSCCSCADSDAATVAGAATDAVPAPAAAAAHGAATVIDVTTVNVVEDPALETGNVRSSVVGDIAAVSAAAGGGWSQKYR